MNKKELIEFIESLPDDLDSDVTLRTEREHVEPWLESSRSLAVQQRRVHFKLGFDLSFSIREEKDSRGIALRWDTLQGDK